MRSLREFAAVAFGALVLAVVLTWPMAARLGTAARIDNNDGQFGIWNVSWVAHALTTDPRHVYDANIFYPNTSTLAYSENNLLAGALAIPFWTASHNPYLAYNVVALLSMVLAAIGMYYLARHLTGDGRAAVIAGIGFGFCPYVMARMPEMQLLMTAGLPLCMLAFHRMAERPTIPRGGTLGLAMALQAAACGYYGVFVLLMVGFATVSTAVLAGEWRNRRFWLALMAGAVVAVGVVLPLFLPYARLQQAEGFSRPLEEALRWSADWRAYFASAAPAHGWLLRLIGHWREVVFPGLVTVAAAAVGVCVGLRGARRDVVVTYVGLALLACWASFGPEAGLYSVLYRVVPVFSLLRAPARFGLIVVFALAVIGAFGVRFVLARTRPAIEVACLLAVVAAAELRVPLEFPRVEPLPPVYRMLAGLPMAPVIELPFYYPEVGLFQHTKYMLASTSHWKPLVNGYSDYIPPDFTANVMTLAPFPSRDSLRILAPLRVRYALFHLYGYNDINRAEILGRLEEFGRHFRLLYGDETTRLYEIVSFPD